MPRPPRVRVLPEVVANQIAAGEVVERPASVVKELVENALDAGAKRVKVEVLGGGVDLIRVEDDGCGMSPQDAEVALVRHGTSKLLTLEDLLRVRTMGFRGEALPSIASVSRFSLRTRETDAEAGVELRVVGGEGPEISVASAAPGTAIEVADLFFNTPARRKFLKRPATELSHVSDVVVRTALAHPEVGFKLLAEGRSVLEAPALSSGSSAEDEQLRLTRILGKATARELVPLVPDGMHRAIQVRGWFGRPPLSERGARGQHSFVNGRFVREKTLQQAIQDSFRGRLPQGRQAVVVLFVELDPEGVDVNVHPQKTEVRFARPGEVFRAVQARLRQGLAALNAAPRPPEQDAETRRRFATVAEDVQAAPPLTPAGRADGSPSTPTGEAPRRYRGHSARLTRAFAREGESMVREAKPISRFVAPRPPPSGRGPVRDEVTPRSLPFPDTRLSEYPRLGVVFRRYLLMEADGALWVLDLDAAWLRVQAESASEVLGAPQALLVPVVLQMDPVRARSQQERLAQAGLTLRLDETEVLLMSAPARLPSTRHREAVDAAMEAAETERSIEDALVPFVDEASTNLGAPSWRDPEAVDALLHALEGCETRDRAVDGRPLVVAMSARQLAQLFGSAPG